MRDLRQSGHWRQMQTRLVIGICSEDIVVGACNEAVVVAGHKWAEGRVA